MKLDSCTPGQREVITTLDKPLMVAAGAGSGKTFTLTNRIAYALAHSESGITDISDVLAITFTKKAAGELKTRIKRELLKLGMHEQALKVDDAWITTIHGMCSRILREHALELGIDPSFTVISEREQSNLLSLAFNEVLEESRSENNSCMNKLLASVRVSAYTMGGIDLESCVKTILSRVLAMPSGFDGIMLYRVEQSPCELVRNMIVQGEKFRDVLLSVSKPNNKDQENLASVEQALSCALDYLSLHSNASFYDEDFDAQAFIEAFFAFPPTTAKYKAKGLDIDFFDGYREQYASLASDAQAGLAAADIETIIAFTKAVYKRFTELKGPERLDNNDLLIKTYQALVSHASLADWYAQRFKMIMIDEFQDTDELQVALVRLFAAKDLSNVCTVGDAQQSIYRFRGADVKVFHDYRKQLSLDAKEPVFVSLPDNFRSHKEILSFVDSIFSQQSVFGEGFLSLKPRSALNDIPDEVFDSYPRIHVDLVDTRKTRSKVKDGRELAAASIANHFSHLRDQGVEAKDMVILLRKMTQAATYSRALRKAGFECMVAGGSTFASSHEVSLVLSTLQYLENSHNSKALQSVLSSMFFNISDDVLLCLSVKNQNGKNVRRALQDGFELFGQQKEDILLSREEKAQLAFAYGVLAQAQGVVQESGLSEGLLYIIRNTGLFKRLSALGAAGQAQAANIYKALRLVRELEEEGFGIARVVENFAQNLKELKLSPGQLSSDSTNFVRIMTIHSSKGLEFGHVVVAEVIDKPRSKPLFVENIEGSTCIAAYPFVSLGDFKKTFDTVKKFNKENFTACKEGVLQAGSAGQFMSELQSFAKVQEAEEKQRLFYVALTRASKSLYISCVYEGNKDFNYEGKDALPELHGALEWDKSEEVSVQMLSYGGSAPARVCHRVLLENPEAKELVSDEKEPFVVPACRIASQVQPTSYRAAREGIVSYSALSSKVHEEKNSAVLEGVGFSLDEDPSDDGVVAFDGSSFEDVSFGLEESAVALGSAFHRIAEKMIRLRVSRKMPIPTKEDIDIQSAHYALTQNQTLRLQAAVERYFVSSVVDKLCSFNHVYAEVPFMQAIPCGATHFFLEGEIDALGYTSNDEVMFVDYKTGGLAEESEECLQEKHNLQARCYAYALLSQGFKKVEAVFVRVEQADVLCPSEPQTVRYVFTCEDRAMLEDSIRDAFEVMNQKSNK